MARRRKAGEAMATDDQEKEQEDESGGYTVLVGLNLPNGTRYEPGDTIAINDVPKKDRHWLLEQGAIAKTGKDDE